MHKKLKYHMKVETALEAGWVEGIEKYQNSMTEKR